MEEWGLGYRATEIIFRNNNILKPVLSSILEGKENILEGKETILKRKLQWPIWKPGKLGTVEGCRT